MMPVIDLTLNALITIALLLAPSGTKSAYIEFTDADTGKTIQLTADVRNSGYYFYTYKSGKKELFLFASKDVSQGKKYSLLSEGGETEQIDVSGLKVSPGDWNPSVKNIQYSGNTVYMMITKDRYGNDVYEYSDSAEKMKINVAYSAEDIIVSEKVTSYGAGEGNVVEFRLAETSWSKGLVAAPTPDKGLLFLHNVIELSDKDIACVTVQSDEYQGYNVAITFTDEGSRRLAQITFQNKGTRLAVLINGRIIIAPVIREEIINGKAIISSNFTKDEASGIAGSIHLNRDNPEKPCGDK